MILKLTNAKMIQKLPERPSNSGRDIRCRLALKSQAFGDGRTAYQKVSAEAVDIKCAKCKGIVTATNNLSADSFKNT